MASFHLALKWSHVAVGVLCLAVFWVAALSVKGSKRHIQFGRSFVWFAYMALATAFVSCIWGLLDPESFLGSRYVITPELLSNMRFFLSILGYGGVALFASLQLGVGVVQCKDDPDRLKHFQHVFPHWLMLAASLGLTAYGVVNIGTSGVSRRYVLPIVAGLSGIWMMYRNVRFIWARHRDQQWWFRKHIESMILSGVTSHVAPAVVIVIRVTQVGWLSTSYIPLIVALVPLVPCLVGLIALVRCFKKYSGPMANKLTLPESPRVS